MSNKSSTPKAETNGHGPKMVTADEILAADDLLMEEVPVPEWGGKVYVLAMTGEQRGALEKMCVITDPETDKQRIDQDAYQIATVMLCLVNEKRERLFVGDKAREQLNRKSQKVLRRVFDAASRVSVLEESGREAQRGNSEPATGSGA